MPTRQVAVTLIGDDEDRFDEIMRSYSSVLFPTGASVLRLLIRNEYDRLTKAGKIDDSINELATKEK